MSQTEYYTTAMRWGVARRPRDHVRPPGPGPGHRRRASTSRCPAACSRRPRTCAASTGSRDRSRTSWRCAPTSGPWPPRPRAASRRRSSRSRSRAAAARRVVDADEHPRADTTLESLGRAAPGDGPRRPRGHGHRRQRQRPERRRRRSASSPLPRGRPSWACAHSPGSAPGPWPASSPTTMGIGPVPASGQGAGAGRPHAGRHGPDRAERGLRRPGAGRDPGVGTHRRRLRAGERERLGHLPRPPDRGHRRAHPGHVAARDGPPRRHLGLETMCIGGGQGLAAVFEAVG